MELYSTERLGRGIGDKSLGLFTRPGGRNDPHHRQSKEIGERRDLGTRDVYGGAVGVVVFVPPDNIRFTVATICNLGGS
jgi:hypothetical protein